MKSNQGPMENLLDGLEKQSGELSVDELKAELQARGINPDDFLNRAQSIIHNAKVKVAMTEFADAVSTMAVGCFHILGEAQVKEIIQKSENLKAALNTKASQ